MKTYILKRILLILPTLMLISIFIFIMSTLVPQDPVISVLQMRSPNAALQALVDDRNSYIRVYEELGMDKPLFYFTIAPSYYPEDLHNVSDPIERMGIEESLNKHDDFFWPSLRWHGSDNRYHHWLSGIIKGDFGMSTVNGQRVSHSISKALAWTTVISVCDIILSFGLGIFLGVYLSIHRKKKRHHLLSNLLYLMYSIPRFWLATLMVVFFTTSDYGWYTNVFPSVGLDIVSSPSVWAQIAGNLENLILPVLCLSAFSVVYITRLTQRGIENEMKAPYTLTAYSKGLSTHQVIRRHALPNASLPLVTVLAGAIPTSLAGSVVIEVIFNIPGIGKLLYDSIHMADWPVVFSLVLLISLVTMVSYLIGDIIYAVLNPKIRYT